MRQPFCIEFGIVKNGMRRVYLLSITELEKPECFAYFLPLVEKERQEKVLRHMQNLDRACSLGAGLLLKYAADCWYRECEKTDASDQKCHWRFITLEDIEGILPFEKQLTFYYGPKGKPYFKNLPLFFSLSHSGNYVACGISDGEIGLDIQQYGKTSVEKLGERFFTAEESTRIKACMDPDEKLQTFYRFWTQKESYGKLTGSGIIDVLSVSPEMEADQLGICMDANEFVRGYMGCICWSAENN